ncbi:Midasin [Actinoplanes sp. NPDC049681]|uniref:Midasin n=1 Tax=Actinoplanes sp. NPDC049681 TaxID=3363905 RepID=UPI0037B141D3
MKRPLKLALAVTAAALGALPMASPALAGGKEGSDRGRAARDSDRDGMPDKWEKANGLNPHRNDAKGDADHDKLRNLAEYRAGTRPRKADTDRDGMPDGWEVANKLRPTRDDADADPDGDELTNEQEYEVRSRPKLADTNGDGTSDGAEDPDEDELTNVEEFLVDEDPLEADSDDDGVLDGAEDLDDDGLSNRDEFDLDTDPQEADSDDDGVLDGAEDSDGDGFTDEDECRRGSDPWQDEDENGDDGEDGEDGDDIVVGADGGTVESFDAGSGLLIYTVADGFTVVVSVTDDTEIEWDGRGCGDAASIDDLNAGQLLGEVTVADWDDTEEIPVAEKVELVCE